MATFCVKCGAPLSGPFCVKCGANMSNFSALPQPPSPVAQAPQPAAAPTSPGPAPAKQGLNALAKLGIAAVVIIFLGGAVGIAGVYYVAHRVSQKIHQATDEILRSSSDSSSSNSGSRTRVSQPRVLRVPVAEARLWAMHADFSRKKM